MPIPQDEKGEHQSGASGRQLDESDAGRSSVVVNKAWSCDSAEFLYRTTKDGEAKPIHVSADTRFMGTPS